MGSWGPWEGLLGHCPGQSLISDCHFSIPFLGHWPQLEAMYRTDGSLVYLLWSFYVLLFITNWFCEHNQRSNVEPMSLQSKLQECKNHRCGLENYLGFGLGALFFLHIMSGESEERQKPVFSVGSPAQAASRLRKWLSHPVCQTCAPYNSSSVHNEGVLRTP